MKQEYTQSKRLSIALIIIGLLVVLFSCNNEKDRQTKSTRNDAAVHIVLSGNPSTLDPQATSATITAQVNRSVYDTLLAPPDGTPLLAESWKVSEDRRVWTFILKPNIVFHDGSPLSSADVVATFERMRDEELDSVFASDIANFTDLAIIDNTKFSITLARPDSSMPLILASSHMAILPKSLIESGHDFARHPIGTGPFSFESWEDGTAIFLARNAQYHSTVPSFETLKFFVITDVNAQSQAIIRNEIDIIPYVIEPELSLLKSTEGINIVTHVGSTILLLAMNTRISPLNNIETRKAIAKAIDKQKVIDIAYPNGRKTNLFWHSNSNYFVDVPEIFDPQDAKEYFSANPLERTLTISVPLNFPPHVRAAQVYQTMLEEIGVKSVVEKVEWGVWLDSVYGKGEFDLTVIGHTGKLAPGQRLNIYADTGGYVGWKNEKFSTLINQAIKEPNLQAQTELYKSALRLITEEYPFVFVAENSVNFAIRSRIKNMKFDPVLETYDFRSLTVE